MCTVTCKVNAVPPLFSLRPLVDICLNYLFIISLSFYPSIGRSRDANYFFSVSWDMFLYCDLWEICYDMNSDLSGSSSSLLGVDLGLCIDPAVSGYSCKCFSLIGLASIKNLFQSVNFNKIYFYFVYMVMFKWTKNRVVNRWL